ncbi:MAG: hypothetical protein ACE5E8_12210, partial [Acidimicrobiia bacterium]
MKGNPLWVSVSEVMRIGSGEAIKRLLDKPPPDASFSAYVNRLNAIDAVKEIDLHVEEVAGEDKTVDVVVDIFNRVNSGGTKLSKGDLALARVCAAWPEARDEMKQRLQKWEKVGFNFRLEWLLRNINVILTGEALFSALKDVAIEQFREGLVKAESCIDKLLNMIGSRLGLDHGRVLGSQHTSTREFRVVIGEDEYLQLDDLVVVGTDVPGQGEVNTYGVVTEVEAVYEGASFESDTFRIAEEGSMPGAAVRSAQVSVTRVDPELWVAPDPGGAVRRATGASRDKALYTDEMGRPLPVGLGRDGLPVYVDLDFFDGRKGGHMSVSGISGVATKTSFALFFLRMLTGRRDIVGDAGNNLRVLVFNVKGEDLLWLDKPNRDFSTQDAERWRALGVDPEPFPSVSLWAPPRPRSGDVAVPDTAGRQDVAVFAWTPREFIEEGLLRFLFTDASDSRNQISFVAERVESQLRRYAVDVAGRPGAVVLRDPAEGHGPGSLVTPNRGERVVET